MTMEKTAKVAAGSAGALAILVAGGLAIALPAQAAPIGTSVSVVEPVDATDTADSTEIPSDDINGVAVEDGHQDEVGRRAG